jgi:hypothetical protein
MNKISIYKKNSINMKNYVKRFQGFSINESESVYGTMPPGKYWIGDLCYVMHDKWEDFCAQTISGYEVLNGQFTVDGATIVTMSTKYGDGNYQDNKGNNYPVDAGLIGAIKVDDITDPDARLDLGNVIQFDSQWSFSEDDGTLIFGNVKIYTGDQDEDDYYEEEYGEEDDEDM